MRRDGGFHDPDITADRQESERQQEQRRLASLSTNSDLRLVTCAAEAPKGRLRSRG